MSEIPPTICRTCRKALDFHMSLSGAGWQHALQDSPADHDADPMPTPPDWRGRCDFCNSGNPTHVLPAQGFAIPGDPPQRSDGDWSACALCARLIEIDDWRALLTRVMETFRAHWGFPMPSVMRQRVHGTWVRLQAHISGPLRPISTGESDAPHDDGPPGQSGC